MKDLVQDGFPVVKSYIDAHDTAAKRAVEANIAPVETDAAASVGTYAIGDQLILNDVLYEATAAIDPGDALETTGAGANIQEADKIAKQIQDANGDITSLNSALSNKQDATLATARIIGGVSRTTVEDALGALADSNYLVDNLTTQSSDKALSANQGYALNTEITNKHKITRKTVNTSSWSTDTSSQSGTTLYKKSISLSHVYVDSPSVDISTSNGTGLPTAAQQTAYDLLQYVTVDGTTMYLYASAIPSNTFYIQIEGVD